MRVWFSLLGAVALLSGVPLGWLPDPPTALAHGTAPGSAPAAPGSAPADEVALGIIVDTTNPRSMQLAREAGFTHAKMVVQWSRLEPKRGRYTFAETPENDLDNVMKAASSQGIKLVIRVDGAPDWAGGSPAQADPQDVEALYAAMSAHGKGTIVAYEVLNEPNLPFEWGGPPSPSGYAAFLKAAYRGVQAGDPSALVIGGGLSPATGGAGGTIEDVDFLRGMYAAGVKGSMDALAVHNYGGNHDPERDPGDCGICFRRAEVYRQVMVDQGDAETPIWATEFGWLLDPGHDMGQYDWMRVSAEQQADYIVRSYRYALQHWPWMTGLLLSNLDASTSPYHTSPQNGMPWFAILNEDHSPRPAWKAFKAWREDERAQASRQPVQTAGAQQASSQQAPAGGAQPPGAGPEAPALPTSTTAPGLSPSTVAEAFAPGPAPTATPAEPPPGPPATTVVLRVAGTDGAGANMRDQPTSEARVIAILMDGTTVEVIGENVQAGGLTWRHVRTTGSTTDGVTGWVAAPYLVP